MHGVTDGESQLRYMDLNIGDGWASGWFGFCGPRDDEVSDYRVMSTTAFGAGITGALLIAGLEGETDIHAAMSKPWSELSDNQKFVR